MSDELPILDFKNASAFEKWLAKNHDRSPGAWLRIAKKESGLSSVSYAEAIDVALCYGWIDGQKQKGDANTWLQKFTPRSRRSIWSKINREKANTLIDAGRMKAPGLAEVERAKQDGRWDAAYDSHRTATVPPDLEAALNANPAAREFFKTINSANRYAILWRIQNAKKPETRAKRIATFVEMLASGKTIH